MTKSATVRASGHLPEYGAIFMASQLTRKECFGRGLFGSPFNCFPFVKEVKVGMLLFLFEYETRKLYGVFQAITDGKLNIMAEAYQQVEKSYPSQVRCKVLWKCKPLCQHEFRHAINENYYAPNKFNLGLSKDQVQKLLNLFYSKKTIVLESIAPIKGKRKRSKLDSENGRWFDDKATLEEGEIENSSNSVQASAGSSTLILPLKKAKKGPENIIVSPGNTSSDLEDYIPLPSPDHDDMAESQKTSKAGIPEKNPSEFDHGNSDHEECIIPKVSGLKGVKNELLVKGLYADNLEKKNCVFSRLNLMISKQAEEEKKDDLQSPDGVMRKLQESRKTWKKSTAVKEQKKDRDTKKKASAFSRLTISPKRTVEKNCESKHWGKHKPLSRNEEKNDRRNKKRQSVFLRIQNGKNGIQTTPQDPSRAKETLGPVFGNQDNVEDHSYGCLHNQILSEESFAGKEMSEKHEECSTKTEISNVDKNEVSQKEVMTRNEQVVEVSPKTLLFYVRRGRRLSVSPVVEELKLSIGADETKEYAYNGILGSEKLVCV